MVQHIKRKRPLLRNGFLLHRDNARPHIARCVLDVSQQNTNDEAHFWLNGYVNKQNCRIWSEANPQVYVETPLHPEKLTVWCALGAGGIIGPYFFKNGEGHNVTVNGDRYRAMITNFFIPELNNHDVQELWFQQDCATCHISRATIDLLKDTFGDRLISRFGPVKWPPRSCDLTPLDCFFCQVIYSQFGLAIHQNDHQARRRFVEWAQNEIAVVPDFDKRILFSDEAHFWLNGYVNKQNCRIWSETNPQVYVETPLHPEKLTVWCALGAGGIIGPYFFKNDEGHNVTVNGDRYRAMITNFFIPELNNHDVQQLWFQQDGAICHTARATIDLLKDTFGDRLISRFGPVNWPPRSCDLTPLDCFL
ncbi:putative DD41D transposase [Trichonephila clavipes]|nr:putative DD41D transposase [Trichonephila clavipes]